MSYTPKPGDRVTSPLLVGEWKVSSPWEHQPSGVVRLLDRHRDAIVYLWPDALVLVAPPLPPEPEVGSVVRAHGRYWLQRGALWACYDDVSTWPDLATAPDLSPVVAVDDVADWLTEEGRAEWLTGADMRPDSAKRALDALANCIRTEFDGGWDK